jgi:hypothetical protein
MLKTNNAQIPAKNAVRVTANPVQVTFMAVFNHDAPRVVKRAGFVDDSRRFKALPTVSEWSDFNNRHHQSVCFFGEARLPVHVNIARQHYAKAS